MASVPGKEQAASGPQTGAQAELSTPLTGLYLRCPRLWSTFRLRLSCREWLLHSALVTPSVLCLWPSGQAFPGVGLGLVTFPLAQGKALASTHHMNQGLKTLVTGRSVVTRTAVPPMCLLPQYRAITMGHSREPASCHPESTWVSPAVPQACRPAPRRCHPRWPGQPRVTGCLDRKSVV